MMSDRPPIPDLLDRLALLAQSLSDAPAPLRTDGGCYLCLVDVSRFDHDVDCGWELSRHIAPSDLDALRRLARALRYGPSEP